MIKKVSIKLLSMILAIIMVVGITPMTVIAEVVEAVEALTSQDSVTNYADFMTNLKVLEEYAAVYGKSVQRDPGELVLNFIRTGVDRYQDDNWDTLAGQEIIGFTNYVEQEDKSNSTNAMALKNIVIDEFILPNGNQADFGHMFGCMNISYVAGGSADLSGWAGDLCDLFRYCVEDVTVPSGTIDEMAAYIKENYLGADASQAFGWDDFYGDMDAYYLISEYQKAKKANSNVTPKFSEIMEVYFTAGLTDKARTVYFMNNRFAVENTKEAVRKAIYDSYSSDHGIKVLEAGRELSAYSTLRRATCYAFADYIFETADGGLIAGNGSGDEYDNDYYSVFSSTESVLAPGVTQTINYAQTVDGKQIVFYLATVDLKEPTVTIKANYKDNDPSKGWGYQTVKEQADKMVENYKKNNPEGNFSVIVATNADGYNMSTGEPGGLLVMDGKEWHAVDADGFFAILDDGKAMIGTKEEYETYKDQIKEAVGGFGAVLVKDGKINVTKNANYAATRASRTAIGIKADGSVVMMVMDGRQLPFSAGGAMEEIAQVMLEAGCVHAINLDGGGSTTFLSKPAGSDELKVTNRPSDGTARSVSTSLVVVSTAKPSTEFDHAVIESEYEYITPGTSMQINVIGVSNTGNKATIPEGSYWKVSDESLGSIDEDGVFTAAYSEEEPITGDVTVQFIANGEVADEKVIHIVVPDDIKFAEDRITAIYGVPKEIELTVWYQGYPVAFRPFVDAGVVLYSIDKEGNIVGTLENDAGVMTFNETGDKQVFIGSDSEGVRVAKIAAMLVWDSSVQQFGTINLYYEHEATFDFENATSGNRVLAYLREVENAKTIDNYFYRIIDPLKDIDIKYTFALDMTTIDIPTQLEPLKGMLPGGTNKDATAWSFLLQLAERVCVQTYVKITVQFSSNLKLDITGLKVINDYFTLTSAKINEETNELVIICNWVDQTAPIDPATANPLCMLTGVKATVIGENYVDSELLISNNGNVAYDIYLAASSLYSFANNPDNQKEYGLYPYIHEDDCRGTFDKPMGDEATVQNNDKGAHFSSQYKDFQDVYTVNSEYRKGWKDNSYYVDNQEVTGVQFIPSQGNPNKKYFYRFDDDGLLVEAMSGLIEFDGKLYYAKNGEPQIRWQSLTDESGNPVYYYFNPKTYEALDGVQQINEGIIYTYTFENYILVKGDLRPHTCACVTNEKIPTIAAHVGGTCLGYRWAGDWVSGQWVEIDGKAYCFQKYHTVVDTGLVYKNNNDVEASPQYVPYEGRYLFDENGVFQKDYTGLWHTSSVTYYLENGTAYGGYYLENGSFVYHNTRLVEVDGYYYYVNAWAKTILKGESASINKEMAYGYVAPGNYTFDAEGRMTNKLLTITNDFKGEGITTTNMGRVTTVKADSESIVCKVGYVNADGKFVTLEAKKNADGSYNFCAPKEASKVTVVVAGDTTGDGQVTDADINAAQDYALNGSKELSDAKQLAGDVNGDGKVTALDVVLMKAQLKNKKDLEW